MALPTVRETWRLALPAGTRLLGGTGGLNESVMWARRMAAHPPAFGALEKGDLALVAVEAMAILDERLTLTRVLEGLAQRGASALAVMGDVPEDTQAAAETHGLALFLLPDDVDLRDIERDIIRLIIEREALLDRRGRQIYRHLAQLSIENQGLTAIAQALLHITGKPAVVQDEQMTVQALAWPTGFALSPEEIEGPLKDDAPLRRWLGTRHLDGKSPPWAELDLSIPGWARLVAAIVIEGKPSGYLSLLGPSGTPDDLDRLAVERGALVCAVEMAKQRAVVAAEDKLRGDFLDLMLTVGPGGEAALTRRAAEIGYELEAQHGTVIFGPQESSPEASSLLGREFRAQLLNTGIAAFLCAYHGDLVALCSAETAAPLRRLEELATVCRERYRRLAPDQTVSIGIGRTGEGLDGLRRSFGQAREALALVRTLFEGNRILSFGNLGFYRLLCRLRDTDELAEFYSQTLEPLDEYDASRNAQLIDTLEAYFAHNGNVSQTAESLYLHRNSLLYRLERIRDITGLDLDEPDDRFSLLLALRIRPLLMPPPEQTG